LSGGGAHPQDYLGLAAPVARAAPPDQTADQAKARVALAAIAKALKQDTSTLEIALREIGEDPFTGFLRAIWNDTGTNARRRHSA
jgi:hypothetical protein